MAEYSTKIDQNERHIALIAKAVDAIDPEVITQASIDVAADAITMAVSTAKSELYSVIRQTATNITSEVVNEISGVSSYIEETASSINSAIAKKNKVYIQMTDPATNNNVIDGDIWIKSVANDDVKPTWSELSAKSWASQNNTNWRDYYSGAWYVRKNGAWHIMREDADVVEIGTKVEKDEEHIALIARTVDENHIEMGARLSVTSQEIRAEVHAAKSNLYSVIQQTATNIFSGVYNKVTDNFSTIEQTSESISLSVGSAKSSLYSSIMQTATYVRTQVASAKSSLSSSIYQTASSIRSEVNAAKSSLYSSIMQTATYVRTQVASAKSELSSSITVQSDRIDLVVEGTGTNAKIKPASIVSSINGSGSSVIISASHINLSGYVKAADITADYISARLANFALLTSERGGISVYSVGTTSYTQGGVSCYVPHGIWNLRITKSGNTYTLQRQRFSENDWVNVGSFSRAVSSWTWGGGNGKINVTALPQNQTKPIKVSIDGPLTISTNGTYTYTVDYENADGDDVSTGATKPVTVNVPGKEIGWQEFHDAGNAYWSKCWTGDGTHGSVSGKHYVTGPTASYKNGWEVYYCIEDEICPAAGITPETHTHNIYLNQIYDDDVSPDSGSADVYYGKLYNSRGQSITSSNRYWYSSSNNIGSNKRVYY